MLQSILEQQLKKYQQWDFIIFLILTLLSVLNGQTTVFYLMYFFWCNELIRIIIDKWYAKKNPNVINKDWQSSDFTGGLFSMSIYWVFLVVFFGFIAASNNSKIIFTNMEVLFFHESPESPIMGVSDIGQVSMAKSNNILSNLFT